MADHDAGDQPDRQAMIADLGELIRALDARVPRLERAGEREIAQDAAALRDRARKRIEQLASHDGS